MAGIKTAFPFVRGNVCAIAAAAMLASAPLAAQTPGFDFSNYNKGNANKPIDIESDRLEVDDKKHTAVFIGNVTATQGDYNLRAPRLEVTYESPGARAQSQNGAKALKASNPPAAADAQQEKGSAARSAKANQSAAPGDPMGNGQIRFVHATGKVLVTSQKDEQTATGNEALYDVKAQKITMTGDVTLSQKGNIVNGDVLSIDLGTGRAIFDPDKKRRIRALLPVGGAAQINPLTGDKKSKGAEKAPARPKAAGSGWQAQSQ